MNLKTLCLAACLIVVATIQTVQAGTIPPTPLNGQAYALASTKMKSHGHDAMTGPIKLSGAFARASASKSAKSGAAYLTINNTAKYADRLLSVTSTVAKRTELHTVEKTGSVMKMYQIDGIEIPAGGMVRLEPGGYHIMFMGLNAPFQKGQRFKLTLLFEKAGPISTTVNVGSVGAKKPGHSHERKH